MKSVRFISFSPRPRQITVFLLLFVFVLSLPGYAFVPADGSKSTHVKGELLVKYHDAPAKTLAREANLKMRAEVLEEFADLGWQRVKVPDDLSLEEAIDQYKKIDGVEDVQPNYYYHIQATPNDPLFASGMYGLTTIQAPQAWDLTTGSPAVVVADIDTGLRYTHQDLAANVYQNPGEIAGNGVDDDGNGFVDDVRGWDFFYNDNDPADQNGHGTHTAGTIGAVGNNALGVVGVNWNVKILPIKIYSPLGTDTTSSMLVNAYNYVRMMKLRGVNIRVTNNSYGGCGEACGYDQATKDALDAMGDAGILNVFSAGNANKNNDVNPTESYPSIYTSPSILATAASDQNDQKASFSNWGPISVDLTAPGVGIVSTYSSSDTATTSLSGTSMAAPHVSGSAALLAALNPSLSVASLKATLMNNVDVLPQWNGLVKTGGRLNVFTTLQNQTVCSFNMSGSSLSVPTKGGFFTVNVTAGQNCDYMAKSNSPWIKILSTNTLSGNGSVSFRVPVNPAISRTGTITIAGQTFTVTQKRN